MNHDVPSNFKEDNGLLLDLSDEDNTDVYLIRAPKGFEISKLHGTEFSNGEIKEIEVEVGSNQLTSVYELSTFSGQGLDVLPLIRSGETSKLGLPMKGYMSVNKSYRANLTNHHDVDHKVAPTARVVMPEGLRVRFQPFGAGIPLKPSPDVKKKKKKRKRKYSLDTSSSVLTPDILHVKKKRKTESDAQQHIHKKHKRKKE